MSNPSFLIFQFLSFILTITLPISLVISYLSILSNKFTTIIPYYFPYPFIPSLAIPLNIALHPLSFSSNSSTFNNSVSRFFNVRLFTLLSFKNSSINYLPIYLYTTLNRFIPAYRTYAFVLLIIVLAKSIICFRGRWHGEKW